MRLHRHRWLYDVSPYVMTCTVCHKIRERRNR